jgi:hypothetical protein
MSALSLNARQRGGMLEEDKSMSAAPLTSEGEA